MKTHKEVEILVVIEKAQDVGSCVASKNADVFPLGEDIRSAKLRGFAVGSYLLVTVRCSEKYRFILNTVTLTDPITDSFAGADVAWLPVHRFLVLGSSVPDVENVAKSPVIEPAKEVDQNIANLLEQKAKPPYYYISSEHQDLANYSLKMLKHNPSRPVKVLVYGESGYGKTTLAQHIAQSSGMDCFRMNCATVRDPEEWFGQRAAKEGTTFFEKSAFIQAVEKGNCVVILDEFNRMEPWIGNSLYPMLDDDAKTTVMNEVFTVGPNVIFFATINLGFEYTGTFTLDAAMSNRFNFFTEVGPYDKNIEMTIVQERFPRIKNVNLIEKLVEVARSIRQLRLIGCTLRTIIQVAEAVDAGMPLRVAWHHVFVYRCPQDGTTNVRKEIIDLLNSRIGTL